MTNDGRPSLPNGTAYACEDCTFWAGSVPASPLRGQCRRLAPRISDARVVDGANDFWRVWPVTLTRDWCGEFHWNGKA